MQVLRRHREDQLRMLEELGPAYQNNELVFCDGLGGWLNPMKVTRAVQTLGRRVGQPNLTIRSLRHFHASVGWDWRIGMAVIASFPAREVIISALGTIYSLGAGEDEGSESLRTTLVAATWPDGRPIYTLPVALSIMVFFALCAQCLSTLVVIQKETGSYRWSLLSFGYMTTLAYVGALATYQIGTALGF